MTPWEGMDTNPSTGQPYKPRRWQAEALPAIGAALRSGESPLVIAGTGAGKSVLQAEVIRLVAERLGPLETIVVTAPTQALVKQLSATIAGRCGRNSVGVYYGQKKQPRRRIVVCCNPSLAGLVVALAELGRTTRLLVVDEAHKSETEAMIEAVLALEPRWRVGFTATPFRSDDAQALSLWSCVCYRYTLGQATKDGVLVPLRVIPWDGHEGISATDDACISLINRFGDGPGVVSATSIDDAIAYAERLTAEGIPAVAVHSKMPAGGLAAAREQLEAGTIRAVVHVSLLVEGVDWPFLSWGCLRRPLMASVGFVQQIGRFLRTHPGKAHATILDPHDLLGSTAIGLAVQTGGDFAERLGAWEQELLDEELRRKEGDPNAPSEIKELPAAKAVYAATSWARNSLLVLQGAGTIPADTIEHGDWRTLPASDRQVSTLSRMSSAFRRWTPEPVADGLAVLAKPTASSRLQRGAVSDLICILRWVSEQAPDGGWENRKNWRGPSWPIDLDLPTLEPAALRAMRRDPKTGRLTRA